MNNTQNEADNKASSYYTPRNTHNVLNIIDNNKLLTHSARTKIILRSINFSSNHKDVYNDNISNISSINFSNVDSEHNRNNTLLSIPQLKSDLAINNYTNSNNNAHSRNVSLSLLSNPSHKSKQLKLPSIVSSFTKETKTLLLNANTSYLHPTKKKLSNTLMQSDQIKFKTLIFNNINIKKYSNVNQSKFSYSNTNTNEIDENIPPSFLEFSMLPHAYSKKGNNTHNGSNSNNNNNNCYYSSSNSDSRFKTKTYNIEIDNMLHKEIKGERFNWVAGDIISEGLNSTVYRAYNVDSGKLIVVKKFNGGDVRQKNCDCFINEVKIYEQLEHSNVIKYYSSEKIGNNYYIYLEYIPSGSLRNVIDKYGAFNEKLIKKFIKQILSGLKYLHSKGIIHRDIKCANILLDSKGNAKLTDFGCSKQIALTFSDSSSNGEFCSSLKGTIPWCAPEVICLKKYGKKADIWSLGCTIIEMTGNYPWPKMDNVYQIMNIIGKTDNTPYIPEYLSEKLKNFISCCLIRDPKIRANIRELRQHPFLDEV